LLTIDTILKDHKDSAAISRDSNAVKAIDEERDRVIRILNGIWEELGIPILPLPTKVSLYGPTKE
jgi:hypothetical protein